MILCAPCVADIMNDPYGHTLAEEPDKPLSVLRLADVIERYAAEVPGHPMLISQRDNARRGLPLVLRAVTTVDGLPLCPWCVGGRPWIGRRR